MVETIGHIKNPLTVIAIFAAIAEISGTTVLPFIQAENQSTYVWFLMLFPMFLVGIFFLTLNFNHKVLYAPSDYKNEDNFLKSFSKATTEEKEEKLREEVEETEEKENLPASEPSGVDHGPIRSRPVADRGRHSDLMANYALAEKLSIKKLSKELGMEFRTDVRFETSSNRKIIFDGLAIQNDKVHAAEVKLYRNDFVAFSRLDRVLLESELMINQLKGFDSKEFVLHYVAVIDNPEVSEERLKAQLSRYIGRYNVNVKIHVFTLSDLINEYQYSP